MCQRPEIIEVETANAVASAIADDPDLEDPNEIAGGNVFVDEENAFYGRESSSLIKIRYSV